MERGETFAAKHFFSAAAAAAAAVNVRFPLAEGCLQLDGAGGPKCLWQSTLWGGERERKRERERESERERERERERVEK
jgi:hypothetical protein